MIFAELVWYVISMSVPANGVVSVQRQDLHALSLGGERGACQLLVAGSHIAWRYCYS